MGIERFDAEGKINDEGKFDSEGKDLNFDSDGKLVEPEADPTLDELHAAAKKGSEPQLFNDDNELFTSEITDDLFEDVDVDETPEDKKIREDAEHLDERELEQHEDDDLESDPLKTENKALKEKIRQLELKQPAPVKVEPLEMPADDETLTVGTWKKLQEAMNQESNQQRQDYQDGYVASFYKEAFTDGLNQEEADAAFTLLRLPENEKYDKIHSEVLNKSGGISDGRLNYHRIMRVFEKEPDKKLPLKHQKTNEQNLRHGKIGEHKTKRVVKVEKLDKASQRFLQTLKNKGTPMSMDDVTAALSGSSGVHGQGGDFI